MKEFITKIFFALLFTLIAYLFLFGEVPNFGFCLVTHEGPGFSHCAGLLFFFPIWVKLTITVFGFGTYVYLLAKDKI